MTVTEYLLFGTSLYHDIIHFKIIVPCGNRHLCEASDKDRRGQSYKGNYGLLQEVHLSHQHVGSLGTRRDLFHEVHVHLTPKEPMKLRNQIYRQILIIKKERQMKKKKC